MVNDKVNDVVNDMVNYPLKGPDAEIQAIGVLI